MKILLVTFLILLAGCGADSPSASPSASGSSGENGSVGPQGPAGADGSDGADLTEHRLQDVNGDELPGVLIGIGTNLWNEAEGTQTAYTCYSQVCGMGIRIVMYESADCSGSGYVGIDSGITNAVSIFAARGQRWQVPTKAVTINRNVQSWFINGACQTVNLGQQPGYPIAAYAGSFPLLSPGPWTVK